MPKSPAFQPNASLFDARIDTLVRRAPITLPPDAMVRQAIEAMVTHGIGSIIVADNMGAPCGILTQTDVVRKVAYRRLPDDTPLREVMTPDPVALPVDATIYDAVLTLAERGIRHLVITDDTGRVCGMLSERDVAALHRADLNTIGRRIDTAADADDLILAAADVRHLSLLLLDQGLRAEHLTRLISSLNDRLTRRLLTLTAARHTLPAVPWAWLALGSEGREEQTFSTDQDNGIVFECVEMAKPAAREALLAFANEVNQGLAAMGFPLCKGGIMAGNPSWCLTVEEWQARFTNWVSVPEPEALLNATIFFDFRPIYGDATLAARMHAHLVTLTRDNASFQRVLAQNALAVTPPLSLFRSFVTEKDEAGKAFIDLKKNGARLFVDAARVLALIHGIEAASTSQRLRRAADLPNGTLKDVEAVVSAFHFIQRFRLRFQHAAAEAGRESDNRVYPERLNAMERRILKESLRQAHTLQQGLKLDFQL